MTIKSTVNLFLIFLIINTHQEVDLLILLIINTHQEVDLLIFLIINTHQEVDFLISVTGLTNVSIGKRGEWMKSIALIYVNIFQGDYLERRGT